ncbi:sarcosine oxidase subunit gamma [Marinomonas sp. THO17]|uniref:sarcosine oxidase subunit gamma n=1 Tax=Marinomonas sp. THO17 TaxID=3149048 RepID=UPI00336BE1EF
MSVFTVNAMPELRTTQIHHTPSITSRIKIEDYTQVSRIGFRGPDVEAFLASENLPVPTQPNLSLLDASGIRVVRLSNTEFWLLDETQQNAQRIMDMEVSALKGEGIYRLYCQHSHAMFVCVGEDCESMFAKICGVDLSRHAFLVNQLAQTSVARVNAIVINAASESQSGRFLVLSDIASSQHLWDALWDAAEEFA